MSFDNRFISIFIAFSTLLLGTTKAWAGEVRVYEDAKIIEAKELICKDDLPGAHILLNKILQNSPNSVPALELLTYVDVYLRDYNAVLKNCNKLLSIDPYNISALNRRSYFYLNTNKLPLALNDLNKLATFLPDDSTIQTNRVQALRKLGKTKEADTLYYEAEKSYWTTQAVLSLSDERRKFFVKDLNSRAKDEPKNFLIPLARAHILIKLGMEDKAFTNLNTVLANDKSLQLKALWLRAQAYKKKRQLDKSIADLSQILDKKPGSKVIYWTFEPFCPHNLKISNWERVLIKLKDVLVERAKLYLEKNNFEKTIADCTQAISLDSLCIPAYETRAIAYNSAKELAKSASDYRKMAEITNGRADYLYELARVYKGLNKHKEAIQILSELIKQNPKDDNLLESRASSNLVLKNYSEAIDDYSRLIEMDRKDSTFWKMRGIACIGAKDFQGAVKDLSQAVNLGAGSDALKRRAEAFKGMNKTDLAEKDLAAAKKLP